MADNTADAAMSGARDQVTALTEQNERLATTLREAREQILSLKADVARLNEPPSGYGVFLEAHLDGSADVMSNGRKYRVFPSPTVDINDLGAGQDVLLNESMNLIEAAGFETSGEIVTLKEVLADGQRALVRGRTDEERIVRIAGSLASTRLRAGDALLMDARAGFVLERVPKSDVEELVLEEVPDIRYEDIGGLSSQIEQIRDAVELPFLHRELFAEHELSAPKGIFALRSAGMWKDPDRESCGQLLGTSHCGKDRAGPRSIVLPQHQGS